MKTTTHHHLLRQAKRLAIVLAVLTATTSLRAQEQPKAVDGKDTSSQIKQYPAESDREFDNGSTIVLPKLDSRLIDNLDLLGKLWGFLKYNHPKVGDGEYNWDYELFRMLPEYVKVSNKKQRDQVLLQWIAKYGEIPPCTSCKETPADAFLKPDFSWIENSNAGKELKDKVKEIYQNRHQGEHFYVGMKFGRYPEFLHENQYANMPYPDQGFRLLALYRHWNIIQYFFPYRYLTDKNWNTILKEYIPKFASAKSELEYELAAIRLIGEVGDTHANLVGGGDKVYEYRGDRYAPFRAQFIENKLVVTDYYNPELQESAKLQVGDVITHIAGRPVNRIVDSMKRYYPASNDAARMRNIARDILRSRQATINVKYISDKQKKETRLTLYKRDSLNIYGWYEKGKNEKCYKLLDGNIGYVNLRSFKDEDALAIKIAFRNAKGIIIDIRNYRSGNPAGMLGPYFMKEAKLFYKGTIGNANNPGEFTFSTTSKIPNTNQYYQGKLVVLLNENSQSESEFTAMIFRAGYNTTIVGSTTAGADGNVSTILLPGNLRTVISGIGIYYPNGGETQRVGIVPDIRVEPTIAGIKNGKDEVLEKAIEVISKE